MSKGRLNGLCIYRHIYIYEYAKSCIVSTIINVIIMAYLQQFKYLYVHTHIHIHLQNSIVHMILQNKYDLSAFLKSFIMFSLSKLEKNGIKIFDFLVIPNTFFKGIFLNVFFPNIIVRA